MKERPKRHEEWGLPRLTWEEAARILDVPVVYLMRFVEKFSKHGLDPSQRSRWGESDDRPVPEYIFRAFITWQEGGGDISQLAGKPLLKPPSLVPGARSGTSTAL